MNQKLKNDVKRVLEYSQDLNGILNVDDLIKSWRNAKRNFIDILGDNLYYEFPETVSFELSHEEKIKKVEAFAEDVRYKYGNEKLADFVLSMIDCFFSNSTDINFRFYDKNSVLQEIQKGTKIVKAFKYFEPDKILLESLQNKASQIIQEDKVSGKLCISVHPLDYLSSSENTYNWRSCHALDGEYRSGNLSYMTDSCTLVCYLKSEEDKILPRFPSDVKWNSKKWRVLLHISNDRSMLILGRQYPFTCMSAPDFITKKLLPASGIYPKNIKFSNWTDKTINTTIIDNETVFLNAKYVLVGGFLKQFSDFVQDGENALNFNDVLRSSCYTPIYCYTQHYPYTTYTRGDRFTNFKIGHSVKCLKCGQQIITNSETVLCNDCEEEYGNLNNEDFGYCTICNRHMRIDEGIWVNDQLLCESCAEEATYECYDCGQLFFNEELIRDTETNQLFCDYCYRQRRNW